MPAFIKNHYEGGFRPQYLRNWEVIRRYPNERPRARRGHTKIIADDRGHLLPGVPRIEPWCHFRTTWQLPKRITRKLARDINNLRPSGKHLTSWEKRSYHAPLFDKNHTTRLPSATREKRSNPGKKEIPIVEEKDTQNCEEALPEEEHERDYSLPLGACRNPKIVNTSERARKDIESYQEATHSDSSKKEPSMSSGRSPKSTSSQEYLGIKKNTFEGDFVSSQFAKSLAQDNLKHKPLPDAITNKTFQSRQMKIDSQPKLACEVPLNTTAVGHRKYKSPGPTQCSKLNVFRPHSAYPKKADKSNPVDRATFEKQLGPIDLAICWDLTSGASGEPTRSLHIDGTNDVAGPSIFNIVKTPRDDGSDCERHDESRSRPKTAWEDKPVNPSAVMDVINNNSEITGKVGSHKKNETEKSRKLNGSSRGSSRGSQENRNPNIASNGAEDLNHNSASTVDSEKLTKTKHYRSSPNLSTCGVENSKSKQKMLFSRPCMACETKDVRTDSAGLHRPKSDYKMAFKAGVPNHSKSSDNSQRSETGNRPTTGRHQVSVPRPKTPFAKKNYAINSLAPPFSLWPGTTGMDYPEHWRLASVYQHSFKPMELRKKPFLQGVYH